MKTKSPVQKKKTTFKEAVEATNEVKMCYAEGKQAIEKKDRDKVDLADPRKCGGSLFIDKCLLDQKLYAQDNRWDYAIDYNGEVFFFEAHTASTKEVSTVLAKLKWLKTWLHSKAPEINKLKAKHPFYWVQSTGNHIDRFSPQSRQIAQEGLKPIPKLVLK